MPMTLKAARINKGFTQKQAALLIGCAEDTIGNWERGLSFPDIPQLKKLEKAYEVPYSELIFLVSNSD